MRVLIVKTSSLGDVVHTLPAVTDACATRPDVRFDWLVEESLAEIPGWHSGIERIIPVALRRWRTHPARARRSGEWQRFKTALEEHRYDRVIDAQGLIKSAWISRLARLTGTGRRCGPDWASAREPLAALAYGDRRRIPTGRHAVARVRDLFSQCLDYPRPESEPDFGLDRLRLGASPPQGEYLVFLHGTTWPTKLWPVDYWMELASLAAAQGYEVYLPWGSEEERVRATAIAEKSPRSRVPEHMPLSAVAALLAGARAVVAVDTGLSHLAAALNVPSVSIYGATRPGLTGTVGLGQRHVTADFPCAPCLSRRCRYRGLAAVTPACYQTLPPERVWREVQALLSEGATSRAPGGLAVEDRRA